MGTLIAVLPSPFKLGNTKLIALAAPVEVGIIAPSVDLALVNLYEVYLKVFDLSVAMNRCHISIINTKGFI